MERNVGPPMRRLEKLFDQADRLATWTRVQAFLNDADRKRREADPPAKPKPRG